MAHDLDDEELKATRILHGVAKEEIEVGEYVRNDMGKIDKVINPNFYIQMYVECERELIKRRSIKNHSKNIIDLIEVGDYVNGEKVIETQKELGYVFVDKETELGTKTFTDYQIESILTKEQFNANCYEVKE